jgi:hypothetical protein
MPADILIVDEANDHFSAVFSEFAEQSGVTCRRARLEEAGREVTIQHEAGRTEVSPQMPLLLRPIEGGSSPHEEEQFVWSECFAAVWSLGTLSPCPVVNRPDEWGWGGRTAFSANLCDVHRGAPILGPEIFWWDLPPEDMDGLLHQELAGWQQVKDPLPDAPIRSRRIPPRLGWDQVIVVGEEGFRVTEVDIGPYPLEEMSVAAARQLGLCFATISWGIAPEGAPFIARINAFPALSECVPVLYTSFGALLRLLTAR